MDALHQARAHGIPPDEAAWDVQRALMDFLESHWREPDDGIWEIRGERRHFVHSKVMAWAAVDRAVRGVEEFGLDGPADDWKRLRDDIVDEVCDRGFDTRRGTFTQYYGSRELDAALLLIPAVGFLPAKDERVAGTVAAIERDLCRDGFVQRYTTTKRTARLDGLPPGKARSCRARSGWPTLPARRAPRRGPGAVRAAAGAAQRPRPALRGVRRRGGAAGRQLPQALSHLALVNTAFDLASDTGPSHRRGAR